VDDNNVMTVENSYFYLHKFSTRVGQCVLVDSLERHLSQLGRIIRFCIIIVTIKLIIACF